MTDSKDEKLLGATEGIPFLGTSTDLPAPMTNPRTQMNWSYDDSADKLAKAAVAYIELARADRDLTFWEMKLGEAVDEYVARQPKAWTSTRASSSIPRTTTGEPEPR